MDSFGYNKYLPSRMALPDLPPVQPETNFLSLTEASIVLEENAEKIYQVGKIDHSFDKQRVLDFCEELWERSLEANPHERKRILFELLFLRFLADSTRYVNFEQFYSLLSKAATELQDFLLRDYTEIYFLPGNCSTTKSNFWVMLIVLDILHPFFEENKVLKARIKIPVDPYFVPVPDSLVVFFDDGIYSGSQVATLFDHNRNISRNSAVYILCPFRTEQGERVVGRQFTFPGAKKSRGIYFSTIREAGRLQNLNYFLPAWVRNNRKLIESVGISSGEFGEIFLLDYPYYSKQFTIPVYFDHKLPDEVSSPECFYTGTCKNDQDCTLGSDCGHEFQRLPVALPGYLIGNCPSFSEETRVNAFDIDRNERNPDRECPFPVYKRIPYSYRGQTFISLQQLYFFVSNFEEEFGRSERYRFLQNDILYTPRLLQRRRAADTARDVSKTF